MSSPILVGYERTESAERALDRAVVRAHELNADLLVHAVHQAPRDPMGPRAFGTLGDDGPIVGAFPEQPDLHEVLKEARDTVNAVGVKKAIYVWAIGEPCGIIVETAKDHHCQLVVGQGHHSLLGRAFGAGAAAEVQQHAGISVKIVE